MAITINQNENQLISISNNNTQEIGINQNENQLINIENSNTQDIDVRQNENQLILIDGGGNIVGITDVLVNGVTVVSGTIAYVIVPTKTSDLINDSGYITTETDPTVPSYIKQISIADINNWNNKQNALVSGSNIKTINNESLLGSGNIEVGGADYSAGIGINIDNRNVISNTVTSYEDLTDLPIIPTKTSELINDNHFIDGSTLSEVAYSGDYNDLNNLPEIPQNTSELVNDSDFVNSSEVSTEIQTAIATKQDTLVSGTNIKTINNNSLLGSGNINITGGTRTDVLINDSSITINNVANIKTNGVYNDTTNKIATMSDIPTIPQNLAYNNINNNFSTDQTINGILKSKNIGCWQLANNIVWSANWSWVKPVINAILLNNTGIILYANSFYIPANVSLIKISVSLSYYNVDVPGDKNIAVYKNGTIYQSLCYTNYNANNNYANMFGFAFVDVNQSDEIHIEINSSNSGTMRVFDSSKILIEIIG